jgi:hypothetical protein
MFKNTIALVVRPIQGREREMGDLFQLVSIRLRSEFLGGLKNCMDFSIANRVDVAVTRFTRLPSNNNSAVRPTVGGIALVPSFFPFA